MLVQNSLSPSSPLFLTAGSCPEIRAPVARLRQNTLVQNCRHVVLESIPSHLRALSTGLGHRVGREGMRYSPNALLAAQAERLGSPSARRGPASAYRQARADGTPECHRRGEGENVLIDSGLVLVGSHNHILVRGSRF